MMAHVTAGGCGAEAGKERKGSRYCEQAKGDVCAGAVIILEWRHIREVLFLSYLLSVRCAPIVEPV